LFSLPILYPSLEEQQKMADCLSSLDNLITAENEKLDALKTHKKGLMQKLFPVEGEKVPKMRFPEFKDSGEWLSKLLGSIGENLEHKRII
jgi:type I restriction enzyme S subunit